MRKQNRLFEIRTMTIDNYLVVIMDLETYNESLKSFLDHTKDESFNEGFEAGQCPYPTEEELADMDANDSKEE